MKEVDLPESISTFRFVVIEAHLQTIILTVADTTLDGPTKLVVSAVQLWTMFPRRYVDLFAGKTLNIGPQKLVYTLHQPVGVWYVVHICHTVYY